MHANKFKISYFFEGKIFTSIEKNKEIIDATYDSEESKNENKGLIFCDENNNPFFFQTNLNTKIKKILDELIENFNIVTVPTSQYEIELNSKLQNLILQLQNLKNELP